MSSQSFPVALTIAGSDSCGGAGVQADVKTFTMLGVYGTSVLTAITAQNTLGVHAVLDVPIDLVRRQFDAVTSDIAPGAVKTGMLSSIGMIELVAELLATLKCPYVCDPVMVSKSGAPLIAADAIAAVRARLLPLADVITPNRFEVEQLTGVSVRTPGDASRAARILAGLGARAVIIKGIERGEVMLDLLRIGDDEHLLEGIRQSAGRSHGSGCTFSAAIAAELAKGQLLMAAATTAKRVIDAAISHSFIACKGVRPVNVLAYKG